MNKNDLEIKIDLDFIKNSFNRVVLISAKSGEGIKQIENEISNLVGIDKIDVYCATIANERQLLAIKNSLSFIK